MSRTLLLVDDEEEIGAALVRLLRRGGYNILRARSGQEGLALLARYRVEVVISDQRMPEMTGVEFLSRVKELYPKTVRMVLSGYADLDSVTAAVNRGAIYKYLTKPWDNETLCASVAEAFEHSELMQKRDQLSEEIQNANIALATLSLELAKLVEQRDWQIERLASYDTLTNLPNRSLFLERLNRGVVLAQNDNSLLAVMFIELGALSQFSGFFAHPIRDQLLKHVAEQLKKHAGQGDTVAYLGGDRFGVVMGSIKQRSDAVRLAQNIPDSLSASPVLLEGREIHISTHVGTSIYPLEATDTNDLINKAEMALSHST